MDKFVLLLLDPNPVVLMSVLQSGLFHLLSQLQKFQIWFLNLKTSRFHSLLMLVQNVLKVKEVNKKSLQSEEEKRNKELLVKADQRQASPSHIKALLINEVIRVPDFTILLLCYTNLSPHLLQVM